MKTIISDSVQRAHPNLESILWRTACMAKEHDTDIMINGLMVRITKSRTAYWTGSAEPFEISVVNREIQVHPSGRIDLKLTEGMVQRSIVVLFAHELRHIGQFHRGRKKTGILSADGPDYLLEEDCTEFEREIAEAFMGGTKTVRGSSG